MRATGPGDAGPVSAYRDNPHVTRARTIPPDASARAWPGPNRTWRSEPGP